MFFRSATKPYITVLDIGSFKVCGFMAHISADGTPEIIGVGFAQSKGIRAGSIVDLNQATDCIASVLAQIEKQSGHTIESVSVNISSAHLKSYHLSQELPIPDDHAITGSDVTHLVDSMVEKIPSDEEILHRIPISYATDKDKNLSDPRGLFGNVLKAHLHIITIPEVQLRNLVTVMDRCHVRIDYKVATPYATGLAVLSEKEKNETGAMALDIGAGSTSFAIFTQGLGDKGCLIHLGLVDRGGQALTSDISKAFSCSLEIAERLKTLNGAAFLSPRDELERLIVPLIGEETENNKQIPRADLIKVIIPRLEQIFEDLSLKLAEHELFLVSAHRIVLCGGTGQLQGIKEKIESMLNANVRLGKVNDIKNLPNQFDSYTFITCVGLLNYVLSMSKSLLTKRIEKPHKPKSRLGKVLQWLMK